MRNNKIIPVHVHEDELIPTWIAYEVRETYPVTNQVFWTQKLDGPYKGDKLCEALDNLNEVKRQNKDVRNIRMLIEN